jgi:hypothetical protein
MVLKIAKPPRDKDSIMGLSWQCCSWMVSVSRLSFKKVTPPLTRDKDPSRISPVLFRDGLQVLPSFSSLLHCLHKIKLAIFTSTAGMSLTFFTVYFLKICFRSHPFSFDFSPLTQLFLRPQFFALLYL